MRSSASQKAEQLLTRSKESFQKLITEHEQKIADFIKDPIGSTNPDVLKKMMADNPASEVLLQRVMGRVEALQKQLAKQIGELQKVEEAIEQLPQ